MNSKYTVFVDLDGVLADFSKKFYDITGTPFETTKKSVAWAKIQLYNDYVEPFFENLPLMNDADHLWEFIKLHFDNICILSASGSTPSTVVEQKNTWINNKLGITTNRIIVKNGLDKKLYATPNSILIDDREKVLDPWIKAGGIGILHTSASDTIQQLKKALEF